MRITHNNSQPTVARGYVPVTASALADGDRFVPSAKPDTMVRDFMAKRASEAFLQGARGGAIAGLAIGGVAGLGASALAVDLGGTALNTLLHVGGNVALGAAGGALVCGALGGLICRGMSQFSG